MIQDFREAKKLMHQIAKEHNLKNEADFIKLTNSKEWKQYSKLLPKRPWNYYSKENVIKRRAQA